MQGSDFCFRTSENMNIFFQQPMELGQHLMVVFQEHFQNRRQNASVMVFINVHSISTNVHFFKYNCLVNGIPTAVAVDLAICSGWAKFRFTPVIRVGTNDPQLLRQMVGLGGVLPPAQ
jgi:hypothetical protein